MKLMKVVYISSRFYETPFSSHTLPLNKTGCRIVLCVSLTGLNILTPFGTGENQKL